MGQAYGTFLLIGFLIGLFFSRRRAAVIGLSPAEILNLSYLILILGVVGARFAHWGLYSETYEFGQEDWDLIAIWNGGLVYYGGLMAGIGTAITYAWCKKIPAIDLLDLLAPAGAIGLAITRIGCFLNGCCFGRTSVLPWSVQFPAESYVYIHQRHLELIESSQLPLHVHPTQLYEFIAASLIFSYLWFRYPYRRFAGEIIGSFGLLYSCWRFFNEFWRADSFVWIWPSELLGPLEPGLIDRIRDKGCCCQRTMQSHSRHTQPL